MSGAIAAGNRHTAAAGMEVLAAGGNAVDAAVAAALATFAAEPCLASAGGGAILLVAPVGEPALIIDAFPLAPGLDGGPDTLDFEAIALDFGPTQQTFHVGRGSAAVPTVLSGLALAAERFGSRPLPELVAPAVDLARRGVPQGEDGVRVFRLLLPILRHGPETVREMTGGDDVPAPDTPVRNPGLADLLERFGQDGRVPATFEAGLLEHFGLARGGQIGATDLARARPRVAPALTLRHGDWTISTSHRPGGRMIAHMLDSMARADVASQADAALSLAEAGRSADQARRLTVPGSTTHVSVVDARGTAAAFTLSNGEGSGFVVPGTGVLVNNFLGEEDLNPGGFHLHAPGDPLPTMMAPTLARGPGGEVAVIGSGGANRIRSAVSSVVRWRVAGRTLEQAILAPRVHGEAAGVWYERVGWDDPDATDALLRAAFDEVVGFDDRAFYFGGVHGVERRPDGSFEAVGDPRRAGVGLVPGGG